MAKGCHPEGGRLRPTEGPKNLHQLAIAADLVLRDQPAEDLETLFRNSGGSSGVRIPETRLFEDRFFSTKRFDRADGRRIHVITASGLLHADHRAPSLDYVDIGAALWSLSNDIREVEALLRLMAFNARIGNRDDHAKNFSFLWMDGRWSLAPAYDLVPDHGHPYGHMTSFAGSDTPTEADVERVAKRLL